MELINNINDFINNIVWGIPLIVCILGIGIYYTIRLGFPQITKLKQIYKGTEIQIFDNVLTKIVKIKYCNIFYETKQIEGYRQDLVKKRTNKNR